jgi:hypothetical protein
MKNEVIGKIRMHVKALTECLDQLDDGASDDSSSDSSDASDDSSDDDLPLKGLSMKLQKYKG